MATNHPADMYSEALEKVRQEYLGTFDTNLPCNCGKATIHDHASGHNPRAQAPDPRNMVFGPSPSWQDRLDDFRVYHEYSCDECGATYRNDVIEGTRGYQPREKQKPPINSHQVLRASFAQVKTA